MTYVILALVFLGIGFGLGRVKNASKLAAARAELNRLEVGVPSAVKSVIAAIRAKL